MYKIPKDKKFATVVDESKMNHLEEKIHHSGGWNLDRLLITVQ